MSTLTVSLLVVASALAQPPLSSSHQGSDVFAGHPLRAIGDQMVHVQQRLAAGDASTATQETQQRIADGLRALIESLASQGQSAAPQETPGRSQPSTPESPTSDPVAGAEAARDSSGEPEGRESALVDVDGVLRTTVESVWGHLPERFRTRMRSPQGVEFLPQYRGVIESYYRRLAEDRGADR